MRTLATRALRQFAHHVARNIPREDIDDLSKNLSIAIIKLPQLCLLEVSQQLGYIYGQLNIPQNVVDRSMEDLSDTSSWHESLLGEVLKWTNEILGLFSDEHENETG